MKLTNTQGLPPGIVQAVKADPYDKGDSHFSVTELINPPIIRLLRNQHWDDLEEDVSDRIWALFGSIGHAIIERAGNEGNSQGVEFIEKRLYIERLGRKIGGQIDICRMKDDFTTGISDYKFTSVYSVMANEEGKSDWVKQLNLYALICRENGIPIDYLEIIALLRDWRPSEFKKKPGYPPCNVKVVKIPLWDAEKAEKYLMDRVNAHMLAEHEGYAPVCTPEERWERPARWALIKPGANKALKLYDTLQEASVARKPPYIVEKRPGESIRCQNYCSVAQFCEYGKRFTDAESAFDAED